MFNVIVCHKLLELTGIIRRTIVTLQLVLDSMCGEMSLQGSDHFIASLVLELVDFKVAGIVVYGAEVVCLQNGRYRIQLLPMGGLEFCAR